MRTRRTLLLRVVVPSAAVVTGLVAATAMVTSGDDSRSAVLAASSRAGSEGSLLDLSDAYDEAKTFQATAQRIATDQRMAEIAAQRAAAAAAEKARLAAEAEAARKAAAAQRAAERAERARLLAAARAPEAPAAAPAAAPANGYKYDVWTRLRNCESGGRYDRNSGNGYYGAYQFHPRTWRSLGYSGLPHQAPPEVQDEAARRLQARSGWGQWPACSRRIGVR